MSITRVYITGDVGSPNGRDLHVFDCSVPNQQAVELKNLVGIDIKCSAVDHPRVDLYFSSIVNMVVRDVLVIPAPSPNQGGGMYDPFDPVGACQSGRRSPPETAADDPVSVKHCRECNNTGVYTSPLSGKKSPCTQGCQPSTNPDGDMC